MGPLRHTGDSANIAFFTSGDKAGNIWCEALRNDDYSARRENRPRRLPWWGIRVYRYGVGEIGNFKYAPKTKPSTYVLPDRTVTRLVRQWLANKGFCSVCSKLVERSTETGAVVDIETQKTHRHSKPWTATNLEGARI